MSTRVLHRRRRSASGSARIAGRTLATCLLAFAGGTVSCQEVPVAPESPSPSTHDPGWAAPDAMLQAALDDAAQRTTIARDALSVVSAETVTWRDGSLGCPQPGMLYTQALVPGYRIVIQAGDRRMRYHASQRGRPVFCPENRAVDPAEDDRT
jgi:hypothetical protein